MAKHYLMINTLLIVYSFLNGLNGDCGNFCNGLGTCCYGGCFGNDCGCCGDYQCINNICCAPLNIGCTSDHNCCGDLFCHRGKCKDCLSKGSICSSDSDCCVPLYCNDVIGNRCH